MPAAELRWRNVRYLEASMPAKSATNSGALLSVQPKEVQALFGDPPLLRSEDIGLYNELMGQFAKIVEPKDMIEWWWVKGTPQLIPVLHQSELTM
jgi:hypothetical protein